jgi:Spy/CpxP family protein refolding chaperone
MISFRSSLSLSLVALVAALAGCSGGSTVAGANTTGNVAAVASPESNGPHGHHGFGMHHRGGPDGLIHAALREPINLTPAQRTTIEALVKQDAPQKPAFDASHAAKLAAAIRSNTVEQLQPPAQDTSARDAHIAAEAAKLTTLHDTLTAEQRTQLVDAIAKRQAEHAQHRGEDGAKGGKGPGGHEHGGRGEHMGGEGFRGHAFGGPMLEGLDLTQAQKDAIKAKLEAERPAAPTEEQKAQWKAQHESMRAAREAQLQTFKGNSFDAKAFVTPPQMNGAGLKPNERRVNHLAVITSVLTPAQREILAKRIEAGPQAQPSVAPAPAVK